MRGFATKNLRTNSIGLALLTAVVVFSPSSSAVADMEQDFERCANHPNPENRIAACTALILLGGGGGGLQDEKLAHSFNNRGIAYSKMGNSDRAIKDYSQAIRLNPKDAFAFNNRGIEYSNKDEFDRAIKDHNEAIRLKPDYAKAFHNRGQNYSNKGRYDLAIKDYNEAIRLQPDYAQALNNKAWTLATAPQDSIRNGAEAVALAKRAFSLSNSAANLDTLAAAHAEAGDFIEAIDAQQRVIRMLRDTGRTKLIRSFQSRLDLYRNGHPYRTKE